MFEVMQAGWGNTLQDKGRHHCRAWGLGSSGPLDPWHFCHANLLAGNQRRQNAIEIRRGPVQLLAHQATRFSVCGYGFDAFIDRNDASTNKNNTRKPRNCINFRAYIDAGERLIIRPNSPSGTVYLAVYSGFANQRWQANDTTGETILGSASVDITAQLGRPLQKGDQLHWLAETDRSFNELPMIGLRPLPLSPVIRAIEGPEHAMIPERVRRFFWKSRWQLSPEQSRMAVRLQPMDSPPPKADWPKALSQLPSHAVFPSTIQLPTPETPIVLLAESQTTGGYPRIASVIQADLWKFAHLPLGKPIYWQKISNQVALEVWKQQSQYLQTFLASFNKKT